MNVKNDIILYLAFWALYGPAAVTLWYYEHGSLFKLSIVLLMGLGAILGILLGKDKLPKRRTKLELPEEDLEFIGFRNLFSQNKNGEVVQYE
ncbi:MAG: hypothetical protein V1729_03480 [Candidatus Woesearchaeota archaeon]